MENLIKTECCDQCICDDEDQYVLFSYAHNSCRRNHRRYTLCGYHFNERHSGAWQTCTQCSEAFETELYVYHGTNEYNFEKLENPPAYEPTRCATCGQRMDTVENRTATIFVKPVWLPSGRCPDKCWGCH